MLHQRRSVGEVCYSVGKEFQSLKAMYKGDFFKALFFGRSNRNEEGLLVARFFCVCSGSQSSISMSKYIYDDLMIDYVHDSNGTCLVSCWSSVTIYLISLVWCHGIGASTV